MAETILIAYGSKHGSTAETAEAIAGMLREAGLEADIYDADAVRSLEGYDAVIVGGSIYVGRWHKAARGFIERFADELREMPVAIFAMGPLTSQPADLSAAREQLDKNLRRLPDIGAGRVEIFGGVIHPEQLHFPSSRMPETDARDWDAVHAFAEGFGADVSGGLVGAV